LLLQNRCALDFEPRIAHAPSVPRPQDRPNVVVYVIITAARTDFFWSIRRAHDHTCEDRTDTVNRLNELFKRKQSVKNGVVSARKNKRHHHQHHLQEKWTCIWGVVVLVTGHWTRFCKMFLNTSDRL
jgi:hypothetical protein